MPAGLERGGVTRVRIVASSAVVRAGLEAMVRAVPGVEVVDVRPDWGEDEPGDVPVDVVVADVVSSVPLPGTAADGPDWVLLTDDFSPEWTAAALRARVRAVLPRHVTPAELALSLEAVALGLVLLPVGAVEPLAAAVPASRPALEAALLTAREREVLGLLAEGLGNKEIAWRLQVSEHTVKFHVAQLLQKLGAGSRTEAVSLGIRQGLVVL